MAVSQVKSSAGPTSLAETARLTGEFADWHNLHHSVTWLTGDFSVSAVRTAWRRLSLRHDVLRRTYVSADEARTYAEPLSEVEFSSVATDDEAIEWMHRFLGTPFRLDGPGFSRIAVVRSGEDRYLLGIALDHIINDLASWIRFLGDFAEYYDRALAGGADPDVTNVNTYQAFATQERRLFAGQWGEKRRTFWRSYVEEFGTVPPPFSVGAEHIGAYQRVLIARTLPPDARSRVQQFSQRARATPFAAVAAGVLAGMREVTGEPVAGITTNQHGRMLRGTAQTAGLFVQTVPLHLGDRTERPLETVQEVFDRTHDVFEYCLPLLVAGRRWNETLMVPDKAAGVYVGLNDQPPSAYGMPRLPGTESEDVEMHFPGEKRWPETVIVTWNLYENEPGLVASYNENYFPGAAVEQLLDAAEKFVLSPG